MAVAAASLISSLSLAEAGISRRSTDLRKCLRSHVLQTLDCQTDPKCCLLLKQSRSPRRLRSRGRQFLTKFNDDLEDLDGHDARHSLNVHVEDEAMDKGHHFVSRIGRVDDVRGDDVRPAWSASKEEEITTQVMRLNKF